jgi:drug/metabolite transporter (DMT)-like permease
MIAGLMPFMTVLVNWLLRGARPAAFTLGSIAVALTGVFLVVTHGEPGRLLHGGSLGGDLMILLGVICWTVYTFGATRFGSWSTLRYTALSCALGSVSIIAITVALTLTGISHVPDAESLAATAWPLGYIIVFCSVFAVLAWNSGIKSLGAVNGVLFINLIPISAFLIGLAMGHTFTAADVCGAGLTVLSLVANNIYIRISQRAVMPGARAASSMAKS